MLEGRDCAVAKLDSLRFRSGKSSISRVLDRGHPWRGVGRATGKRGAEVTAYAVMRLAKLKTAGAIKALGRHNERTRETPNADPERREHNVRLAGSGDWLADAQARLEMVEGRIRSNAVLGIEHLLTASPEWFERASAAQVEAWVAHSTAWLHITYGKSNVVASVFHDDERTPHLQALVVPVTDERRLSANAYIGGSRTRLVQLQDSYAAAVADLGLERGVRGSPAEHQAVRDWYAKLEQPVREAAAVARAASVEAPPRMALHPEAWAERQSARIAAVVRPAVDGAVTQALHYEFRATRAEGNVQALTARVARLEAAMARLEEERRALRATVAHHEQAASARARGTDLPTVLERLGAVQNRGERQEWWLAGERITVTGSTFYNNHDQGGSGGGAIDLVRHATGYTFREAVAWLGAEVGREPAAQAGLEALQHEVRGYAGEQRPPFRPPAPAERCWSQARAYLTRERGLPDEAVDRLHARGDLYASVRCGHVLAVFLCRDEAGTPTGAELRGVEPGSADTGLAAGSRRAEGFFRVDAPASPGQEGAPPRLLITESPINALSAYALRQGRAEQGPGRVLSTDSRGPLPSAAIAATLAHGGRVIVATANDPAGDHLYARIAEQFPTAERYRPVLKDFNEDLTRPDAARQVRAEQAAQEAAARAAVAREEAVAAQWVAEQAHAAELRRIDCLGAPTAAYAREVYDAYQQARAVGLNERGATEQAARVFALRHNGMGAQTLSRYVTSGMPRGTGQTEEAVQRVAQEAVRAALARAEVRAGRDDRGR